MPSNRAGVVIGKGGETINQIKEKSGAFVQINKTPPQDHPDWKYFTIRGNQQQIATAQKLIQVKILAKNYVSSTYVRNNYFTYQIYI